MPNRCGVRAFTPRSSGAGRRFSIAMDTVRVLLAAQEHDRQHAREHRYVLDHQKVSEVCDCADREEADDPEGRNDHGPRHLAGGRPRVPAPPHPPDHGGGHGEAHPQEHECEGIAFQFGATRSHGPGKGQEGGYKNTASAPNWEDWGWPQCLPTKQMGRWAICVRACS